LGLVDGPEVDELLLELFDRTPFQRRQRVIAAIGTRRHPGDPLIDGLISRLRDPELHDPALKALRWLGELGRQRIEVALERGIEASLAAELNSIMDAIALDGSLSTDEVEPALPSMPHLPAHARRQSPLSGARLDLVEPRHQLGAALAHEVLQSSRPRQVERSLFTLALWQRPRFPDHLRVPLQTRLQAWSGDKRLAPSDRCLAVAAVTRTARAGSQDEVISDLVSAAGDTSGEVRACIALALAQLGELSATEASLADPDPRVRAAAALGLRAIDPENWPPAIRQRLRVAALHDTSDGVRSCARFALATPAAPRAPDTLLPNVWVYSRAHGAGIGSRHEAWARFDGSEHTVYAPTFGHGAEHWLIAVGIGDLSAFAPVPGPTLGMNGLHPGVW
jgi:hypothetical protein